MTRSFKIGIPSQNGVNYTVIKSENCSEPRSMLKCRANKWSEPEEKVGDIMAEFSNNNKPVEVHYHPKLSKKWEKLGVSSDDVRCIVGHNGRYSYIQSYIDKLGMFKASLVDVQAAKNGVLNKFNGVNVRDHLVATYKTFDKDSKVFSYSMFKHNLNNGEPTLLRDLEYVKGYTIVPKVRTYLKGTAGKVQRLAMAIAQDANGCERPVLNRLGELIFNIAKRLR